MSPRLRRVVDPSAVDYAALAVRRAEREYEDEVRPAVKGPVVDDDRRDGGAS